MKKNWEPLELRLLLLTQKRNCFLRFRFFVSNSKQESCCCLVDISPSECISYFNQ